MGKASTASKNNWNAKNYEQLRVLVKMGQKSLIQEHAQERGLSLNAYVNKLIADDMGDKLNNYKNNNGQAE